MPVLSLLPILILSWVGIVHSQENEERRLERGDILISTVAKGEGKRGKAVALINSPPEEVWKVITDYEHFADFMPNIKRSKVVKKEADISIVDFKYALPFHFSDIDYTLELKHDEKNKEVHWRMVKGDLDANEGSWHLESYGQQTKTTYTLFIAPKMPVPDFIVTYMAKGGLPGILKAVRRRVESTKAKSSKADTSEAK